MPIVANLNAKPVTLDHWLQYIEALHPKSIAMGLDRVKEVVNRLHLSPNFPIITIAGTNGKGSTCAMLESIYTQAGYRVGCYTSPHLLRYNERVRINQQAIGDDALCTAFSAVEHARGEIALTYFEMGTLAAVWHFTKIGLDVAILEVGMGGRLDAVNVFEPICAIITSIDLDHIEYLGDTREKIGFEKAGIYRANTLAICGDKNPPKSVLDFAIKIKAHLQLIGLDFCVNKTDQGWQYYSEEFKLSLPILALHGDFQLENAACAVCAVQHLSHQLPVSQSDIYHALSAVTLMGRFQQVQADPIIIVDVAHNPQAAKSLAHNLHTSLCSGRTFAVFAMLADKDIDGVLVELTPFISVWYLADIHSARGAKAKNLQAKLAKQAKTSASKLFDSVANALNAACKDATKNDRIIVCGSFYTVADAIESLDFN
ncbi:MAG: bifunctional tetrahydrofolate synthase/dihydrofolate synthase [Methylophilaceae bacterium]